MDLFVCDIFGLIGVVVFYCVFFIIVFVEVWVLLGVV